MEDDDMNQYKKLFEPITIRNMTLDNRLVMAPMGTNFGEQNGEMSFLHMNYYLEEHHFIIRINQKCFKLLDVIKFVFQGRQILQ